MADCNDHRLPCTCPEARVSAAPVVAELEAEIARLEEVIARLDGYVDELHSEILYLNSQLLDLKKAALVVVHGRGDD